MIEYVQMKSEEQSLMQIIKDCATNRGVTSFVLLRSGRDISRCMYQVAELAKTLPTVEDVMGRRIRFTLTQSRIQFYTDDDVKHGMDKFRGIEFFSGVDFSGKSTAFAEMVRRTDGTDPVIYI